MCFFTHRVLFDIYHYYLLTPPLSSVLNWLSKKTTLSIFHITVYNNITWSICLFVIKYFINNTKTNIFVTKLCSDMFFLYQSISMTYLPYLKTNHVSLQVYTITKGKWN